MSQLPLDLQFISTPGRDDFLVSDCNRLATSWIDRWPDWPGQYRVLNLVGPAASGKSHLAAIWSRQADALTITELADGTAPVDGNIVLDNLDAGDAGTRKRCFIWSTAQLTALPRFSSPARHLSQRWGGLCPTCLHGCARSPLQRSTRRMTRCFVRCWKNILPTGSLPWPRKWLDYMVSRMERSFVAVQTIAAAMDRRSLAERRNLTLPLAREIMTEFADGDHARQPALPTGPGTTGPEPEED